MTLSNKVLADGCFDPFHNGHLDYLQFAAQHGELIVNVAPDDAIRAKGREPFQTQHERCRLISALRCVSSISTMSLADAIYAFRPCVLLKGRDWRDRLPADVLAACKHHGTHIIYTDTVGRTSTERLAS